MVIMPSTLQYSKFHWQDLHQANFTFNSPFSLHSTDEQVFFANQILRIIPNKRIVAVGTWQDKAVVAKLFFDTDRAQQHMTKDLRGIKILQDNNIPTPALLYKGISEDRRIYILMFDLISEAENLAEIWKNKKNSPQEILPILKLVINELATQHVLGVLQHDIHLKNFLLTEKRIYSLDGAQIEVFPPLLSKHISINNLALFLAQLGVGVENYQKQLFQYYAHLRGWQTKNVDYDELFYLINKRNNKRWQQFEKKIFRNCSDFSKFRGSTISGMYDRSYQSAAFVQFLKDPDAIFEQATTTILKAGRSATVAKVVCGNHLLVVKRYNMKNLWHRLRRSIRLTRAYLCWRLSQKCMLFGVQTAKPVAYLEKKYWGFRGKSYYVTEYISGENAGDFLKKNISEEKTNQMVAHITALLKNITKLDVTHGDLKITNILINAQQQPVLIDLDGAIEHSSLSGLRNTFQHEIKRFLKNFDDQLLLKEKFRNALISAP
ncbi:MAG: hypothetical protein A3F11_05615 [Gammaproteobacteria bacterium RIFCSPHIGHO2_12_FULL_37_14]|nr:MAG: hypothetical protein A3F11_05615 [Gammaproteobacteria bacterium RIFCSPHIGHO2_12_FULL_37_14]